MATTPQIVATPPQNATTALQKAITTLQTTSTQLRTKSKRKIISIEEKGTIVKKLESGESNGTIAIEFGISHSTISTIWKNKDKILHAFNENILTRKRLRSSHHADIDSALLQWFSNQKNRGISLTGPMLQEQANIFARIFGKYDFKCSDGWIKRFRVRHNIMLRKKSAEVSNVPEKVPDNWMKSVWPELRRAYRDDEIFNADETGLFYRISPERALKFKGDRCKNGEMVKDRITILVAANMTGTEKRKLVVIGKARHPRCFQNVKSLPVIYEGDKKAWMTSDIFAKILRDWNRDLKKSGKKILLLIDDCPVHPRLDNLEAIKLVFLPSNTASVIQPMNQGVFNVLKINFRKLQIMKIIESCDRQTRCDFSLVDVITMLSKAWNRVSSVTVANCFLQSGFISTTKEETADFEEFDEDDEIPLAQLVNSSVVNNILPGNEWKEFVNIDNNLQTWDDQTQEVIVERIINSEENSSQEEQEDEFKPPTALDALQAIATIRNFLSFGNVEDEILSMNVSVLEKRLEAIYHNHSTEATKPMDNETVFVKAEIFEDSLVENEVCDNGIEEFEETVQNESMKVSERDELCNSLSMENEAIMLCIEPKVEINEYSICLKQENMDLQGAFQPELAQDSYW